MLSLSACLGLQLSSQPWQRSAMHAQRQRHTALSMVFPGEGIYKGDGIPEGPRVVDVGEDYVDPLARDRPKYDLCAASGRPGEVCCGAIAPESPMALDEWTAHMRGQGKPCHLSSYKARRSSPKGVWKITGVSLVLQASYPPSFARWLSYLTMRLAYAPLTALQWAMTRHLNEQASPQSYASI